MRRKLICVCNVPFVDINFQRNFVAATYGFKNCRQKSSRHPTNGSQLFLSVEFFVPTVDTPTLWHHAWKAMAKLSIATGHAMQIYNCLNCPRQLWICIGWSVAMLSFATELGAHASMGPFTLRSISVRFEKVFTLI